MSQITSIIDPEKDNGSSVSQGTPAGSEEVEFAQVDAKYEASFWTRLGVTPDSFRRRTNVDKANQLNQTLKGRHLQMIAIGGSIGAGLFVGSGSALGNGGPASLLIDFAIVGFMMFNVVYALGELSMMYPVSGGFYTYSTRFLDPSWGFAMGWNYVMQWAVVLPLELTVAGLTVQYWPGAQDVNIAVFITVFWVALIIISIFGVLGYGEEEFWASLLKLMTVVIFLVIGLVLVCGGGPSGGKFDHYWGVRYFYDPGAFRHGFKGFCSVFVTAAFSFSGTELVGLAAAESADPVKTLPGAIKQVFWRITLFYILGLLFVGLLVSSNDPRLLGNGSLLDVSTSPFVIVAADAGLAGFDSFINVVIMVSIISIGLSGVYGGSRTLTALAEQGYAPRLFTYVDRAGRPLPSTVAILLAGAIAYISLSLSGATVFSWLQALSGLAALFTWGSICACHIRFRRAWKHHGRSLDDLPFKSALGETGSWLGLGLIFLVLAAQCYIAVSPVGGGDGASAEAFFKSYLALPVVLGLWGVGYAWKGRGFVKTGDIDIVAGMREHDWQEIRKKNAVFKSWPWWRKGLSFLF